MMRPIPIILIVALLAVVSLDAKVFYVDGSFQGENSVGESWLSAFPSVQEGINAASTNGGGEIWVKAGVYKPSGEGRNATFQLSSGIKLYGGFRGNETSVDQHNPKANRTILSGDIGRISSRSDNCYHIVTGADNSQIDGFILTAGNADGEAFQGQGGALLLASSVKEFVAANCIFEKNNAHSGGAIHTLATGATLTNCTFYSNAAEIGGALATGQQSQTLIKGSTFSFNYSKQAGGAVALGNDSDAAFSNSSFLSNSTEGGGGAVSADTDQKDGIRLSFSKCIFSGNSAQEPGGALAHRGAFHPVASACLFSKNSSVDGAGAIANLAGALATLSDCTYSGNRGIGGMEDVWTDETAAAVANSDIQPLEKTETEPAPMKKRQLEDVFVHNNSGTKVKLRSMVGGAPHTVLVLGDLTDPDFISHYRAIEAAAVDYAPKSVNFFYIYRYLAHPENNGYIQPFNQRERARQISDAAKLLHTRIPWLCDSMDNQTAKALEQKNNSLFIYNQDGLEEYAGPVADETALRAALDELVGQPENPTALPSIPLADIEPITLTQSKVVKRIVTDPKRENFLPIQTTPLDSRMPFYVKMRVEANEELLKTGNGQLILGFHIDPIYEVEWNNLGSTLSYTMTVPSGSAVAPSIKAAARVTGQATDADPREFILEARKLKLSQPIAVTVTYSVHAPAQMRNIDVVQEYLVYLDQDRFGGIVLGRQIIAKPTKDTRAPLVNFDNLLTRFDIDRDGKLSRDEAPIGLRRRWGDVDTNGDGKLDATEFNRHREPNP